MPNFVDVAVPVLLVITTLWGFSTGYWQALVVVVALLIGVVVAAHFDYGLADFIQRIVSSPGPEVVQALVFIILTVFVTLIGLGIVGWVLSFARPTTRAARTLPSAHIVGAILGLVFGVLLSSVVLMALYLGTAPTISQQVPGAAALRATIDDASVVPPLWRVTHVTDRLLGRLIGPNTPPFDVP